MPNNIFVLRDLLLECPSFIDGNNRQFLVKNLPFANAIQHSDDPRFHVMNIIDACMSYHDNGFKHLLDILRPFDGDTKQFKALNEFMVENEFIEAIEPQRTIPKSESDSPPSISNFLNNEDSDFEIPRVPRYVLFVYVVGHATEIQTVVRNNVNAYSDNKEEIERWKPFLPPFNQEIAIIVQKISSEKNFIYKDFLAGDDLIKNIKKAKDSNKIVIIIVDPWSLKLPKYSKIMEEYNERHFFNCDVLFVLNVKDQETQVKQSELRGKMEQILFTKIDDKPDFLKKREFNDEKTFRRGLFHALKRTNESIIRRGNVLREMPGADKKKLPTI
jgi:FxsC-like protein